MCFALPVFLFYPCGFPPWVCACLLAAWSAILLWVLAALGISLHQGKCISIPSGMHHNFIYDFIPGFVPVALASFLYLWNSCSVQREGFWQLHLDLSGNIAFIWCYHHFGICSSSCNSELRDCSGVLEASDLVKIIINGYCRLTLLLSQEGISAGSQIWKLITTTWDGKAVSETYW